MATGKQDIYIYAHWKGLEEPQLMGVLSALYAKGKKAFSFEYDKDWLKSKEQMLLDPDIQFFSESTRLKIEHQANIIAACCVIPRPLFKQILKGVTENDFPRELWQFRCEAATRYGL